MNGNPLNFHARIIVPRMTKWSPLIYVATLSCPWFSNLSVATLLLITFTGLPHSIVFDRE